MGGIVGKVTDAVGLTDYKGARDSASSAASSAANATAASTELGKLNIAFQKEQLEWQKSQYNDWKRTYGDVGANLGDYYKSLSANTLASRELSMQALEFSRAQKQLTQQLAQQGIADSGVSAAVQTAAKYESATQRANIRAGAAQQVAQQKAGFLGIGLGQGTQMLGIQAQSAATVGNAYNSTANNILQGGVARGNMMNSFATANLQGSYQTTNQLIETAGQVAGGFMASSDKRLKQKIELVDVVNGINIYTWEWTDEACTLGYADQPTRGVIAQEVEPLGVTVEDSLGYLMVDYSKLGVL